MDSTDRNNNQVLKLSSSFYSAYPKDQYPEILWKRNRPYNCLTFAMYDDTYICIPYRSNIHHEYAFLFRHSVRSQTNRSGLDYMKMVIIKDQSYLSNEHVFVDQDEYRETMQNIEQIRNEALQYLDDYISYIHGNSNLHKREFDRRYGFSPLQYFHSELGLAVD